MNGSGCKNCPVKPCETTNYRGSTCSAQRARLGLGDPMTNADRVRAMNDEELAETLIRYNDLCDMFMADDGMKYYDFEAAKEAELEWLKQPAEKG